MNDKAIARASVLVALAALSACALGPREESRAEKSMTASEQDLSSWEAAEPANSSQVVTIAGACVDAEQSTPRSSSEDQAAAGATGLQLQSVTPPYGSEVGRASVMIADLSYTVADFQPGKFRVLVQAETAASGFSKEASTNEGVELHGASGTLHMCIPLARAWDDGEVKWPLVIHFYLARRMESGALTVLASAGPASFHPGGGTPAAHARIDITGEPSTYRPSLHKLYTFFNSMQGFQRLCSERLPDGAALADAYGRWESTHQTLHREIGEWYLSSEARRFNGDRETAARLLELMRKATDEGLRTLPEEQLATICRTFAAYLPHPQNDPEVLFKEQLALIRGYAAQLGK